VSQRHLCVLQCVMFFDVEEARMTGRSLCCDVFQYVAVCCDVFQYVAVCCDVFQYVAMCFGMLQRVAMCFSMLQCVLLHKRRE